MRKRYTIKSLQSMVNTFNSEGKKTVNLLEILIEIGFNKKDIAKFYKEFIGKREYYHTEKR